MLQTGFRPAAVSFTQIPRLKAIHMFDVRPHIRGKRTQPTCNPLPISSSSFCQMWHKSHLIAFVWALRTLRDGLGTAGSHR